MNTYMSVCDGGMGTCMPHSTFVEGGGQPWLSVLNLGADRVSLLFAICCLRTSWDSLHCLHLSSCHRKPGTAHLDALSDCVWVPRIGTRVLPYAMEKVLYMLSHLPSPDISSSISVFPAPPNLRVFWALAWHMMKESTQLSLWLFYELLNLSCGKDTIYILGGKHILERKWCFEFVPFS